MKSYKLNTKKLNEAFNIDSEPIIIIDEFQENKTNKGSLNSFYGKLHTEETKEKIRKKILELYKNHDFRKTRSNFGSKNGMYGVHRMKELSPMWGKKHSKETKDIISNKIKEWYKNNINPRKNQKLSNETKKKISEKNSKSYKLISPFGEVIQIKNLNKFAKDNNLNVNCLYHVVSGRYKKHKGWKLYE